MEALPGKLYTEQTGWLPFTSIGQCLLYHFLCLQCKCHHCRTQQKLLPLWTCTSIFKMVYLPPSMMIQTTAPQNRQQNIISTWCFHCLTRHMSTIHTTWHAPTECSWKSNSNMEEPSYCWNSRHTIQFSPCSKFLLPHKTVHVHPQHAPAQPPKPCTFCFWSTLGKLQFLIHTKGTPRHKMLHPCKTCFTCLVGLPCHQSLVCHPKLHYYCCYEVDMKDTGALCMLDTIQFDHHMVCLPSSTPADHTIAATKQLKTASTKQHLLQLRMNSQQSNTSKQSSHLQQSWTPPYQPNTLTLQQLHMCHPNLLRYPQTFPSSHKMTMVSPSSLQPIFPT